MKKKSVNFITLVFTLILSTIYTSASVETTMTPFKNLPRMMSVDVSWIPKLRGIEEAIYTTNININNMREFLNKKLNTIDKKMMNLNKNRDEPKSSNTISNPATNDFSMYEQEILMLINKERTGNNLPRLTETLDLRRLARIKSNDMIINNYLSDVSPTYGSLENMMNYFGHECSFSVQNIAKDKKTPHEVLDYWMSIDEYRGNILNTKIRKIGIGFNSNGFTWTIIMTD